MGNSDTDNNLSKDAIFIFDMDGVIVNSIEALYEVYLDFLNGFGVKGTKEEFDFLNGPKLEEIAEYLKKKHDLSEDVVELVKTYKAKMESMYENTKLIEGTVNALELLRKKGFKIALASSSRRKNIDLILKRFNLAKYFDFIVSGDDVDKAKPSPEIYNAVKSRFKQREYYVIEDSHSGVKSAAAANMNVIFFNTEGKSKEEVSQDADHTMSKMDLMENILDEINLNCKSVVQARNVDVRLIDKPLKITSEQQAVVDRIWAEESAKNSSLFNGKIVSYSAHSFQGDKLIINCFMTEYKYFLAELNDKTLKLGIEPLAVSGIVIDTNNKVLFGARSETTTEYPGFYELVPSGSISSENINGSEVNFTNQLKQELQEETGISPDRVTEVIPIGLIYDKRDKVFDICGAIILDEKLPGEFKSTEYALFETASVDELPSIMKKWNFVPPSKIISNMWADNLLTTNRD